MQLEPLVHGVQDLVLHAARQGGCDGRELPHLQQRTQRSAAGANNSNDKRPAACARLLTSS